MMKRLLAVLLTSVFILSLSSVVQATPVLITDSNDPYLNNSTVIDFNSESIGTYTSLPIDNVTFSDQNSGNLYIDNFYSGLYGTSGNYLANKSTHGPFIIDFTLGVSAFGFSWGAADQSWTIELFNGTNTSLGTLYVAAQTDPYVGFIGGRDTIDKISYATLSVNSNSTDYFLLDDFEYVIASDGPVPEPATMLLFGIAFVGLMGIKLRRKSEK